MGRAALAVCLAVFAGCVQDPAACRFDPPAALDRESWCANYAVARCDRAARCGFTDGGCACREKEQQDCQTRVAGAVEGKWDFQNTEASACLEGLASASCEAGLADWNHQTRVTFFASSPGGRIAARANAWREWRPAACSAVYRATRPAALGQSCDSVFLSQHFHDARSCTEGTCVSSSRSAACGSCVSGGGPGEVCFSVIGRAACASNAFPSYPPDGGCECLARRTDGDGCTSDDMCTSGVCGDFSLRCGRLGAGERCAASDECQDDAYCRGTTLYRVGGSVTGDGGTCAARIPPDGGCVDEFVDDGCADRGQVCVAGRCGTPFTLPEGAACSDQDECGSGLTCATTCNPSGPPSVSVSLVAVGEFVCGG